MRSGAKVRKNHSGFRGGMGGAQKTVTPPPRRARNYKRRFLSMIQNAIEYSPAIEAAIERAANEPITASRTRIQGGPGAALAPGPRGAGVSDENETH